MSNSHTAFADPPTHDDASIYDYTPVNEPRPRRAPNAEPINISALDFNPPEKMTALILADLTDPDSSLGDIARRANTTVESLSLWMTRPDIAARISALHQGIVTKTQLTIASRATGILSACAHIVNQFNYFESHGNPDSAAARDITLSIRNRQTAIAAGKLYLRLKREFPSAAVPRAYQPVSSPSSSSSSSSSPSSPPGRGAAALGGGEGSVSSPPFSTSSTSSSSELPTSPESPDDLLALRAARFPDPTTNGTAHKYPRAPKPADTDSTSNTTPNSPHSSPTPTSPASPTHHSPSSPLLKFEISNLKSPATPNSTPSRAPPPAPSA